MHGAGLPGAKEVENSPWIQVRAVPEDRWKVAGTTSSALGVGEISAVLLAKESNASVVLMDEIKGRRYAGVHGVPVTGSIGLLEEFHRRGWVPELRDVYLELLAQRIRLDREVLGASLARNGFPPLAV